MISLDFDPKAFLNHAIVFIRNSVGNRPVYFGLSGGVDSSTVAYILTKALPREQITAVLMHESEDADFMDAMYVVKELGINHLYVPLSVPERIQHKDAKVTGNIKARLRMIVLYKFANAASGIVVGTSNKSELLTGYYTKRGDGAADIYPIADLYKTQVYILAKYLGVPERIRRKRPSAGLWPGQYDEEELGIDYHTLDLILKGFELFLTPREIAEELDIPLEKVLHVKHLIKASRHKRWPKILRSSLRAPMFDRREPGYRRRIKNRPRSSPVFIIKP